MVEPLCAIIGAILKVAHEIAKLAKKARRNKGRCRELADRVRTVDDLLRNSKAVKDTDTRKRVLSSLRYVLTDALEVVESCQRGGLFSWLLAACGDAGRFDDVDRRITNCLMELGIANDARLERQVKRLAARGNHPGRNAQAASKKEINHNAKKKDVAMNGNKRSAAAGGHKREKGHAGGKGGKQMKEKAAAGLPVNRTTAAAAQPAKHRRPHR